MPSFPFSISLHFNVTFLIALTWTLASIFVVLHDPPWSSDDSIAAWAFNGRGIK